jgi:hypothetical protein
MSNVELAESTSIIDVLVVVIFSGFELPAEYHETLINFLHIPPL